MHSQNIALRLAIYLFFYNSIQCYYIKSFAILAFIHDMLDFVARVDKINIKLRKLKTSQNCKIFQLIFNYLELRYFIEYLSKF